MAKRSRSMHGLSASSLAFVLLGSSVAQATVPSAETIVSGVIERRARPGLVSLLAEGTRRRSETDPSPAKVKEWVRVGQARRVEIEDDTGKQHILVVRGLRYEWREGGAPPKPTRVRADIFDALVMNPLSSAEPLKILADAKVDTEEVTLGRMEGEPAYVIGAKPWEREKPQLWTDKLGRAPLRFVYVESPKDPKNRTVTEIRWTGWSSAQTNDWLPRRVEVLKNGALVELTSYDRVVVNVPIADERFDPPGP